MNKFALTVALTSAMLAVSASPTHGSQFSRTRTVEGYALAKRQRALADDADAHYQIGATAALSALYRRAVGASAIRTWTMSCAIC